MKNINLLTILLALIAIFPANSQDVLWEKSYGGKHADFLFDVQPTADYGFILAGSSLSSKSGNKTEGNMGDLDYWIWKMDENGELDWQKNFGGRGMDMLYCVRNTNDGGFILAGSSNSGIGKDKRDMCRGNEDFWILKLNAKGGEQWQRSIGGAGSDIVKSIEQTVDGGYIVGGTSSSDISPILLKGATDKSGKSEKCQGNLDYWIVKLDAVGEIKWQRTFGGIYADVLESIEQTTDGGFIIGGYSNSPTSESKQYESYGGNDYWIIKIDSEGFVVWQNVVGGEGEDQLFIITQTVDGGYVAGGSSSSPASGNKSKSNRNGKDFWVVKFDEDGNVQWQEIYDTGKTDLLTSLVENNDGTFLIGGYSRTEVVETKSDKEEINDYIALKISSEGDEIWKKFVGSKGDDILKALIETRDGGYLLSGTSSGSISRDRNSGQGGSDFWVVKLKDRQKKEKRKLQLEAIPNPALDYTNIIVGFDFTSGTLSLFDLAGRQLQIFPIDSRTIPLNMNRYPEGVYIVEVKTEKGTESVKVIKAKR